jgi:hypothetical protein
MIIECTSCEAKVDCYEKGKIEIDCIDDER